MRLFHLSDLHIGKRVCGFSMLEDQAHILSCIIALARQHRPHAVLICGDVYDKSIPQTEAVTLFDDFLTQLAALSLPVLLISGNHDSPERLGFGSRLLAQQNIHIVSVFDGTLPHVTFHDEYGIVHVHMLPFVRSSQIRRYLDVPEDGISAAIRALLQAHPPDITARNLLLAHQFVVAGETQPLTSDSETMSLGGVDAVQSALFHDFDYVALGHLHAPQSMGSRVRYGGSPLKYSFSECNQHKGVTLVTLTEKGNVQTEILPLSPLHDLRILTGSFDALLQADPTQDYLQIRLSDQAEVPDAFERLRRVYPNLMQLRYERSATHMPDEVDACALAQQSPQELFSDFFERMTDHSLSPAQEEWLQSALQESEVQP